MIMNGDCSEPLIKQESSIFELSESGECISGRAAEKTEKSKKWASLSRKTSFPGIAILLVVAILLGLRSKAPLNENNDASQPASSKFVKEERSASSDIAAADSPTGHPGGGPAGKAVGQALSCPASLEQLFQINELAALHFALLPSDPPDAGNGILCGRLELEGEGWVALATSKDGAMVGSEAIIGLPDENKVMKYSLDGKVRSEIKQSDRQTLQNASIAQQAGRTVMTFTKLLQEDGEIPILQEGTNFFLYAWGRYNNFGYHGNQRLAFQLDFSATSSPAKAETITSPPTKAITNQPTEEITSPLTQVPTITSSPTISNIVGTSPPSLAASISSQPSSHSTTPSPAAATSSATSAPPESSSPSHLSFFTSAPTKTASPSLATVPAEAGGLSCPNTLDSSIPLGETTTLFYAVVPSDPPGSGNAILCARVDAEGTGWLGLGVSVNGMMVGSEAIIGLPDENTVLKYNLNGKATSLVAPMPDHRQTLRDTSIVQENGRTIMSFTKLLVEEGEIMISEGVNIFLHAMGNDNTLAYHGPTQRSVIEVNLSQESSVMTKAPSPHPTTSGAPSFTSTVSSAPTHLPDSQGNLGECVGKYCSCQLSDDLLKRYRINVPKNTTLGECKGCTISMELIYEGEAWLSIGFSTDGRMVGTEAVIGVPEEGNEPLKYYLSAKSRDLKGITPMPDSMQTLTDASIEITNGHTIMKFTKVMNEPGEIEITTGDNYILWAHGVDTTLAFHSKHRESYLFNLSGGEHVLMSMPNKAKWIAHGILGFIAWGVIVPFGYLSTKLSGLPTSTRHSFHWKLMLSAFSISVIAIAVGAFTMKSEGGAHFDGSHEKMGLALMVLSSFQIISGIVRPKSAEESIAGEKSKTRWLWEIRHRVVGIALFACAMWQMREGISLFYDKYGVDERYEQKLAIAYWIWIGITLFAIIVVGNYLQHRQHEGTEWMKKYLFHTGIFGSSLMFYFFYLISKFEPN